MKIVRNDKLIKRNAMIGQVTSFGGLALLIGSLAIVWLKEEYFAYAWAAMLGGFLLSQVGLFFGTRWGRRPRPDERLDEAFKGMDDRYSLYHYSSPVSHLLVGPAGIWVFLPRMLTGKISFENGRWKLQVRSLWRRYLNLFGQEGIGRPDLELKSDISEMNKFLSKSMPDQELPEVQAAFVVLNEETEIDAENAPYPAVTPKKLKDLVRRSLKTKGLTATKVDAVRAAIEE